MLKGETSTFTEVWNIDIAVFFASIIPDRFRVFLTGFIRVEGGLRRGIVLIRKPGFRAAFRDGGFGGLVWDFFVEIVEIEYYCKFGFSIY
jgi:hypothetical protein